MGYIYKITCNITNKIYIGKSQTTVEDRWNGHCKAAFLPSHSDYNFPFHRAIRKYGKENFTIETIDEENDSNKLKEKEKYWISYYNSYKEGYNATLGGDGQCKYDYDKIVNYYLSHNFSLLDTCKEFNIYDQVVYTALKSKNIDYKNLIPTKEKHKYNNKILLVEKNLVFEKITDIDRYFNKEVHGNIRRCLNGITEKAYGFHWRELEEEEVNNEQYIFYK